MLTCKKPLFPSGCLLKSYDYNCDGTASKQYTAIYSSCKVITLFGKKSCLGSGWGVATAPACGASADYKTCKLVNLLGNDVCLATTASRTQACR